MPLEMPRLANTRKGNRIAFLGPMAVGKSTCADHLKEHYGYRKFALAGKLKAIAYEMYGVQGKDGNDRTILQGLGTDLRKYDPDVWLKYLLKTVIEYEYVSPNPRVVLDDLRYTNEADILRQNNFVLIRLTATPNILEGRLDTLYPNRPVTARSHVSETEQKQIRADYTIVNDNYSGISDLDALMSHLSK